MTEVFKEEQYKFKLECLRDQVYEKYKESKKIVKDCSIVCEDKVEYECEGNIQQIQDTLISLKKYKKEKQQQQNMWKRKMYMYLSQYNSYIKQINHSNRMINMMNNVTVFENANKDEMKIRYEIYELEKKEKKKKSKNKKNLKKEFIDLPDDILRHIQSYITYENQYELLEDKYNPLRMLKNIPSRRIPLLLEKIYTSKDYYHILTEDEYEEQYREYTNEKVYNPYIYTALNFSEKKWYIRDALRMFKLRNPKLAYKLIKWIIILFQKYCKNKNKNSIL
jgi:hypothetical protein